MLDVHRNPHLPRGSIYRVDGALLVGPGVNVARLVYKTNARLRRPVKKRRINFYPGHPRLRWGKRKSTPYDHALLKARIVLEEAVDRQATEFFEAIKAQEESPTVLAGVDPGAYDYTALTFVSIGGAPACRPSCAVALGGL